MGISVVFLWTILCFLDPWRVVKCVEISWAILNAVIWSIKVIRSHWEIYNVVSKHILFFIRCGTCRWFDIIMWYDISRHNDDNPDNKVHGANMGPTWANRTQVVPMLAPWTLLSGNVGFWQLNGYQPQTDIMLCFFVVMQRKVLFQLWC